MNKELQFKYFMHSYRLHQKDQVIQQLHQSFLTPFCTTSFQVCLVMSFSRYTWNVMRNCSFSLLLQNIILEMRWRLFIIQTMVERNDLWQSLSSREVSTEQCTGCCTRRANLLTVQDNCIILHSLNYFTLQSRQKLSQMSVF